MNEATPDRELLEWLDALCTETITPEQQQKLTERLKADPQARQVYLSYVDVHLGLRRLAVSTPAHAATEVAPLAAPAAQPITAPNRPMRAAVLGLLALAASLCFYLLATRNDPGDVSDTPPVRPTVYLASMAGARFFGEIAPPIASPLAMRRDYVLLSGMAEIRFPTGASAIVEGPAVFRILSDSSMGLDVGQCSVHAPPGAEGFRVETQQANVVDRGTRFSIKVSETSETEVHVIEGAADLYRNTPGATPAKEPAEALARLNSQEARGLADDSRTIRELDFSAAGYRGGLPDRVISYEATEHPAGGVENLMSVTVQRDGKPLTYHAPSLIGVDPTYFRGGDQTDRNGHLTAGGELPARRTDVLRDNSLVTGLINPGGSPQPLTSDPVMNVPEDPQHRNAPGLAIRFARPVINGPGPDVVLFEMQTVTNPADGDAFHVSPLVFAEGLKSYTVRGFDIAMTSSEAKKLASFRLYRFNAPIGSLEELQQAECQPTPLRRNFRMLATGIDLSRLGYPAGAAVEGLFLQDAADDDHKFDPVYIGGLPR